jgi:hypothetical protein
MINILRSFVIGAMAREEEEEKRTTEENILKSSKPDSGKSLVIVKNDSIDY